MKVNRNTISADITYWYYKISKFDTVVAPEFKVIYSIERMYNQLSRLREQLDKASNISERISIERLILDVNSRIASIYQKLSSSSARFYSMVAKDTNQTLKNHKIDTRHISFFDTITVSEKARQKIRQIINEERRNGR